MKAKSNLFDLFDIETNEEIALELNWNWKNIQVCDS